MNVHLGMLLKCRFCFSESQWGLRFLISNKHLGVAIAADLQAILCIGP